jgi:cell division protein ZapB
LTILGFSNYSDMMDTDIKALEEKLMQLIALCQSLRSENIELRQSLEQAQDDTKQLKSSMTKASVRLEALIEQLPQDIESQGVLDREAL